MQRLFSMFPSGMAGYGLLSLRIVVATSLHFDVLGHLVLNTPILRFASLLVLSTLLAAGLFTPIVAALSGVAEILLLLIARDTDTPLTAFVNPFDAFLLVMLGPGAYSADARLFGRRVLVLHSRDSSSRR